MLQHEKLLAHEKEMQQQKQEQNVSVVQLQRDVLVKVQHEDLQEDQPLVDAQPEEDDNLFFFFLFLLMLIWTVKE